MARRVTTQREIVAMSQLMCKHIRALPDKGSVSEPVCEYVDGYDDERIAKEIAPDLTAVHAATLRKNLYGKFAPRPEAEMAQRVATLEQKLGDALLLLAEITSKHDKLVMGISLARVGVDCRHLVIDTKVTVVEKA